MMRAHSSPRLARRPGSSRTATNEVDERSDGREGGRARNGTHAVPDALPLALVEELLERLDEILDDLLADVDLVLRIVLLRLAVCDDTDRRSIARSGGGVIVDADGTSRQARRGG